MPNYFEERPWGSFEILIDDLSEQDIAKSMRIVEAVLFAAEEPLDVNSISPHLPSGYPISDLLAKLESDYEARGVQLKKIGLHGNYQCLLI